MTTSAFNLVLNCALKQIRIVLKTGKVHRIIIGLAAVILLYSCQDDAMFDNSVLPELDLKPVIFTEEPLDLSVDFTGFSHITWEISDGSIYESSTASHIFTSSGNFEIKAIAYQDGIKKDSSIQYVNVYASSLFINLDREFYSFRSRFIDNEIIVEGIFKGENRSSFLKFDKNFNLLGIYDSEESLGTDVFTSITINGKIFSFNEDNSGIKTEGFKSTEETFYPEDFFSPELISYSRGIAHYFEDKNSDFKVEYYTSDLNLLWTKTFSGKGKDDKKYIFNIDDKLYYISFEKESDILNIEKFKNISLSYNTKAFNLGILPEDREILFATKNDISLSINLVVYSKATNSTMVYSIDEDCNLNLIKELPGLFDGKPIHYRMDGSQLVKTKNSILKYNSNWDIIENYHLNSSYASINSLGDNLYLVCESVQGGIRLSYLDKNLQKVAF